MKKYLLIILAIVAAIAAYAWWSLRSTYEPYVSIAPRMAEPVDTAAMFSTEEFGTNAIFVYEETLDVDPRILGQWRNDDSPLAFRVFTNENADDGFCWGYEWDESEDVYVSDLVYQGNGWFRWRIEGNQLLELHMMEASDAVVPVVHTIQKLHEDRLVIRAGLLSFSEGWRRIERVNPTSDQGIR